MSKIVLCCCCFFEMYGNIKYCCNGCKMVICGRCLEYGQKIGTFSDNNPDGYYYCSFKCFEKDVFLEEEYFEEDINKTLEGISNDNCMFISNELVQNIQKREFSRIYYSYIKKVFKELNFIGDVQLVITEYLC